MFRYITQISMVQVIAQEVSSIIHPQISMVQVVAQEVSSIIHPQISMVQVVAQEVSSIIHPQISMVQVIAQEVSSIIHPLCHPQFHCCVLLFHVSLVSTLQFEEVADKDDLMGVEDTAKRNILCHPPFSSSPFPTRWGQQPEFLISRMFCPAHHPG